MFKFSAVVNILAIFLYFLAYKIRSSFGDAYTENPCALDVGIFRYNKHLPKRFYSPCSRHFPKFSNVGTGQQTCF